MVGRTLAQYRVEERLGKGGMGTVYRAFDTRLKRNVAIKILSRSEESEDELARLLGEARAAAPLNHPAIATIHEVGEAEDVSFIVMELVTGGTLREAYAGESCEPSALARIGMEVALGLQAAHEHGVIHGDIKSDNLMVGPEDQIKILDFGVARRLKPTNVDETLSIGDVYWNAPGTVSGTIAYMAPEQLRGERIDGRADLYSLGVVLYELATRKRPYEGESASAVMARVLSETSPPLRDLEREQPTELVRIVGKLLAKDFRERYQSARELNVQVIVEGSIQRLGPQMRVQVQAWEAAQGATLLSVKLDGQMAELFDLQDRLADVLADGLGIEPDEPSASEPPTLNPRAYELYLRASERLLRYNLRGTRDAIEMFRSAVGMDALFAEAWARLSAAAVSMAVLFDPDSKWYVQAEQAVDRALKLDPTNAEAWATRGRILWSPHHDFRHTEALRCFGKVQHLPSRPHDGPLWEGVVLIHVGLHGEARSCLLEALEEQPDDLIAMLSLGEAAAYEGDHAAALEHYDRTLALEPSHVFGNMFVQTGLLYLDELDKAERALVRARGIVGEDSLLQSAEALLWAKRGESGRADEHVRRALENLKSLSHAHHTRHYLAAALATMGQPERALEQLRLAAKTGLPNYPLFLGDRHFDSLRARPDFREFLAGLKPGWEACRREFGSGGSQGDVV